MFTPLSDLSPFQRVRAVLPPDLNIHLVGGAVRDALLGQPVHDLDFVLADRALQTGRQVANALHGAYYPLDDQREYARVVYTEADGSRYTLDFALQQGPDLESDLRARDFTINALAVDVHQPGILIDPLGGLADLREKKLRACSPAAFERDALRILRAVRLASVLQLSIDPVTRRLMRQAVPGLADISPERLRDELFRLLDGSSASAAIESLAILGVWEAVLPELHALKGVAQSAPHVYDVWEHTLHVLQGVDVVLGVLAPEFNPDVAASLNLGLLSLRLGRYRRQIGEHFSKALVTGRPRPSLLRLAALYHDVGKPATRQVEPQGRVRFLEHEHIGAELAGERGRLLHLSNIEVDYLQAIVRNHLRPLFLAQGDGLPSRKAIYRFFRSTGDSGVDICLLSLADTLATYGPTLPQTVWTRQLDIVRVLLEAWWEKHEESVAPPSLVNGNDLLDAFQREPGPWVGRMLEAIREAQATGQISQREDAFRLARELYRNESNNQG
jgi:poly(A) polymerase